MRTTWMIVGLCMLLAAGCRPAAIEVNAAFERSPGLAAEDRILVENNDAGRVTTVTRQGDGTFLVGMRVSQPFANVLTTNSRCYVIEDPQRPESRALEIRTARKGGTRLAQGETMEGIAPEQDLVTRFGEELAKGLESLERRLHDYRHDLEGLPENDAYRDFKKSLRNWMAEMAQAGNDARQQFEDTWLPRIQRQLDELKKQFEQKQGDKPKTPPENVDRPLRI